MQWRQWGMGLVLAGPVVVFPFSRAYYVFYVLILVFGLIRAGLPSLWRAEQGLRLAVYGLVLPILIAIVGVGFVSGHVEKVWLEKLVVAALAALLGLAAAGLARERETAGKAAWLIVAAILSWMLDGLWQLATGYSISGQPMLGRLTSYFSHPYKFGFFVSFMALLPVFFFHRQPGRRWRWLTLASLLLSGLVVVSAGSRFGMLGWLGGVAVFVFLLIRHQPLWQRLAVMLGLPLLLAVAVAGLYLGNASFADRVNQTAQVLHSRDYQTIDAATSGRLDIWYPATALARDHWFWGVGPSQISEAIKPYLGPDNVYRLNDIKIFHAHQVLLEIWLGVGLIGVAGFLVFYAWVCAWLWRERERAGLGWTCVLIWALAWLPFGTHLDFYASEMLLWSFYMLGLGFGLQRGLPIAVEKVAIPEQRHS